MSTSSTYLRTNIAIPYQDQCEHTPHSGALYGCLIFVSSLFFVLLKMGNFIQIFRQIFFPKTKFWFASSFYCSSALRAPVQFTVSVYERVRGDLAMLHENHCFGQLCLVFRKVSCRMRHQEGTGSSPLTDQPVTKPKGNTSVLIWLLVQSIYPDNNKILFRVCFFSENSSVIGSECLGNHSPLSSSRATVENKSVKHGEWGTMRNFYDICLRLSKCIVFTRKCGPFTWSRGLNMQLEQPFNHQQYKLMPCLSWLSYLGKLYSNMCFVFRNHQSKAPELRHLHHDFHS